MTSSKLATGLTAFVTGAGSGIGRGIAQTFAAEGAAAIALIDVNEDSAAETAVLLDATDVRTLVVAADVGRVDDVERAVAETVAAFGRIDCAVNNAGVRGAKTDIVDCTDDQWLSVVDVNLNGMFYCLRAEVRAMRSTGGGAIVNVSSGVVADPVPGLAPYSASKFGVVGLTRAVAGEINQYGIRINAVLPGSTVSGLQQEYLRTNPDAARGADEMPMGRFGQPAEVAEAVVWFCSQRSSFVHGATLLVDGGSHAYALPIVRR